jgi:hypothetical protein
MSATVHAQGRDRPLAYDPYCRRYAKDIPNLDFYWAESQEELDAVLPVECERRRDDYVWTEEGTLNVDNGHFACDACYIALGMPSSPTGWTAP